MSGPDDDFDVDGEPEAKSTGVGGGDEFDFEVEMWDDAPFTTNPISSTNLTNPVASLPTKPPAPPSNQDEDQDMWDIVDELQVQAKPNGDADPPKGPPAPVDDDDWDSMYA